MKVIVLSVMRAAVFVAADLAYRVTATNLPETVRNRLSLKALLKPPISGKMGETSRA
jgi:hypothetical protein